MYLYLGWAHHRAVEHMPFVYPQYHAELPPYPYPDRWLNHFHNLLDDLRPVPPGTLKMHGELPRVRLTLSVSMLLCAFGSILFTFCAWKLRPVSGHCPACGYDLRGNPGAACPECGAERTTMNA